jgi:hypothetical protein
MRFTAIALGSMVAALGAAAHADAHGLDALCKFNGDRVELEAYFDDDTPARQADVSVKDAAGQIVAQGQTDAAGHWSFARPVPGVYHVIVDAGAGHRKRMELTIPRDSESSEADTAVENPAQRTDFTRRHWPQLAMGLAIIAGLGLVAWGLLRLRPVGRPS